MKLLKSYHSLSDAKLTAMQLQARGILTFIANEETKNQYTEITYMGIISAGVWIVLDYQYEDAVQVLGNPDHVVLNPLTANEMALISKEIHKPYSATSKSMIKTTAGLFIAVVILCVISYFLKTST